MKNALSCQSLSKFNNYLYNSTERILFQLTGSDEQQCGIKMFPTTEGVHLVRTTAQGYLAYKDAVQDSPDVKAVNDLILADVDFTAFESMIHGIEDKKA